METESISIREVHSHSDLRAFLRLPFRLHLDHSLWVPPLMRDERDLFVRHKNPALNYCDLTLALARREERLCGRIAGIINHRYNRQRQERTARFGWFECQDDYEAAMGLLNFVCDWAKKKGMTRIVGPMGFTDQDPEGLLIEGFDHEPTISTYANYPYMNQLVESCGFTKEVDYVVYKVLLSRSLVERYQRISSRILDRGEFRLIEFKNRRQLKPYLVPIITMMNDTFADLYGYVPLDADEIDLLARRFQPLLDPRFVKFVMKGSRGAGFLVAMPNLDAGLRKAKGKLWPFGFVHILRVARRTRQLDLLVGGARSEDRGRGMDAIGMAAMLNSAAAGGFEIMDSHLELETNTRVRAEMEKLGGKVCKRYRIYGKSLNSSK
jgi:hypothetical protein